MSEREFDVVVVGAGPAGEVAAGRLADAGLEVVVVEPELIGGECSYWACMPSKALLRPGELYDETRRVPGVAEAVGGPLDAAAVLARRDEVVHDFDDSGQVEWLDDKGVTLVRAHGRLDGERRVRAGDDVLVARKAVILATGSGTNYPPIDGLAESRPWGNREGTAAKEVPRRLAILGGGVVGVEMADAWRSLGAQVTLIEGSDRPLEHEERFAGELVQEALRVRGVRRALRRQGHVRAPQRRRRGGGRRRGRARGGGGRAAGGHRPRAPHRRPRAWTASASSPGSTSTSTTRCARRGSTATGCTRWGT